MNEALDSGTGAPEATGQQGAEGGTPPAGSPTEPKAVAPEANGEPKGDEPKGTSEPKGESDVVYEFKAPEGVVLDKAATDEFTALAKELKLPADAAQKAVDIVIRHEQSRLDAFTKQVAQWEADVKADKDLGGDKLSETLAVAKKAVDLGPPGLAELLSETKMGSHPMFVKWAYAVGKALSESKFVPAAAGNKGEKSAAEVLYPTT